MKKSTMKAATNNSHGVGKSTGPMKVHTTEAHSKVGINSLYLYSPSKSFGFMVVPGYPEQSQKLVFRTTSEVCMTNFPNPALEITFPLHHFHPLVKISPSDAACNEKRRELLVTSSCTTLVIKSPSTAERKSRSETKPGLISGGYPIVAFHQVATSRATS